MPHSTPALLSLSRNYIGFELNGGIRSLRSRFCTERFDHDQFEFSHSLYRDVVLTSWDRGMNDVWYPERLAVHLDASQTVFR